MSGLRELQDDNFISLNKETLENGFILNIVESQCVDISQTWIIYANDIHKISCGTV